MKKIDRFILGIAFFCIVFSLYQNYTRHIPSIPVVVVPEVPEPIEPIKPELKQNIYYDELEKCKELAAQYQKKIVVIFGADWCCYCRDMQKDVPNSLTFENYIACFINIENDKSKLKTYHVKNIPASIIIDSKGQEISRKIGYKNKEYNEWLKNNE